MSYNCECELAGFCKRHQKRKSKRDWQLCQGINCTKELQEKYRRLWDQMSSEQRETPQRPVAHPLTAQQVTHEAVPRDEWPAAANVIAMLATPSDVGVGDTIKRQLGVAGKLYQAAFRALTGSSCSGCRFRQQKWNELYPYRSAN